MAEMTPNEARRLADDIANELRHSIALRPNLNREGWALRVLTLPGCCGVSLTSGASIYTFGSREDWEEEKDMIR